MDDPALQRRLDRIERRQRIVLGLLVGGYLVAFGLLVDPYVAGMVATILGLLALGVVVYRGRHASGE